MPCHARGSVFQNSRLTACDRARYNVHTTNTMVTTTGSRPSQYGKSPVAHLQRPPVRPGRAPTERRGVRRQTYRLCWKWPGSRPAGPRRLRGGQFTPPAGSMPKRSPMRERILPNEPNLRRIGPGMRVETQNKANLDARETCDWGFGGAKVPNTRAGNVKRSQVPAFWPQECRRRRRARHVRGNGKGPRVLLRPAAVCPKRRNRSHLVCRQSNARLKPEPYTPVKPGSNDPGFFHARRGP